MIRVFNLRRLGVVGVALVAAFVLMEGEAMAVTLNVCVPEKEGTAIVTPTKGACEAKYNESRLLPLAEAEKLEKILPDIKYEEKGVDGKPTIRFSDVNVQVVNGEGKTATTNGEGNLVIGYDENTEKKQTGSHNLILGGQQTYTSYGGILAGFNNTISEPFASITAGEGNTASGKYAFVSGGHENKSSGEDASVNGGFHNVASSFDASVSGGIENFASSTGTSVSGGQDNEAKEPGDSVSGGFMNVAKGSDASVSGGAYNVAGGEVGSVSGGAANVATGSTASISGGEKNTANGTDAWIGGGNRDKAEATFSSVFGLPGREITKESEACGGYPTTYC